MGNIGARAITAVLVRAAGVMLGTFGVISTLAALAFLRGEPVSSGLLPLLTDAAMIVAGFLAWLFADVLARMAIAGDDDQAIETDIDERSWLRVAIIAIGVWHAFAGTLQVLRFGVVFALLGENAAAQWHQVVWPATQLLVGVVLVLRVRGVAHLVTVLVARFRGRGDAPVAPIDRTDAP